jgi:hypothetical protein
MIDETVLDALDRLDAHARALGAGGRAIREMRALYAAQHGPASLHDVAPGAKLRGEALAELLNTAERWLDGICAKHNTPLWWQREAAIRETQAMALDLGDIEGGCCFCGSHDLSDYRFTRGNRLVHWSGELCRQHAQALTWPRPLPKLPPARAIGPEVSTWLARRGVLVEERVDA